MGLAKKKNDHQSLQTRNFVFKTLAIKGTIYIYFNKNHKLIGSHSTICADEIHYSCRKIVATELFMVNEIFGDQTSRKKVALGMLHLTYASMLTIHCLRESRLFHMLLPTICDFLWLKWIYLFFGTAFKKSKKNMSLFFNFYTIKIYFNGTKFVWLI